MDNNMFEESFFTTVDPRQNLYHVVTFYDVENNSPDGFHCVPSSWIKWYDKESMSVLLVYPDEPQSITRKRVENYQNSYDNWTLFLAEIMYSSDSYVNAINYIRKHKNPEKYIAEVSIEIESPQCPVSQNSLLSVGMKESTYLLDFEEKVNRQLNSDPPKLIGNTIEDNVYNRLIMSTINEIINLKSDIDPAEVRNYKDDVHLEIPFMSSTTNGYVTAPRTSQDIGQGDTLYKAADNSHMIGEKWTLKHHKYSPGLVELMPNTGTYIGETELKNCLKSSKTSFKLARQLTANIFTNFALRKCIWIGRRRGDRDNRLNSNAIQAIVNFVRTLEYKRSSRVLKIGTVKSAILRQMKISKMNN